MIKGITPSASRAAIGGMLAVCGLGFAPAAGARPAMELTVKYVADVSATLSGGADSRARYSDDGKVTVDADLARLIGVDSTIVHVDVLSNFGGRPNDAVESLQGVDNIEVGRSAVRLFQAWAEHSIGRTSVRLGLYDINTEFYATESSGLLIAPPFGIGAELSATGRNGPSIFPSTGLALRVKAPLPAPKGYMQVAVVNAKAQTFGDPGGVDLGFGDGLLLIGEAGMGERLRGAFGIWTYTDPRDALASLGPDGSPLRARTWGIYGLAEYRFASGGKRDVVGFLRAGLAEGKSNTFVNALQAGVLVKPVFAGRPGSAFSLGYHRATTSREWRAARLRDGQRPWRMEQSIELTYSDALTSFAALQPDLQVISKVDETGNSQIALLAALRISVEF